MIDQSEYLRRVASIADTVRAEAAQADRERRLGDATVAALVSTGLLRMLLPANYGGGDLALGQSFAVCEALARVDASAGWNLGVGATLLPNALALDDAGARQAVLGDPGTIVAGTINFLNTTARRGPGGVVFDGRASFLSGSSHANWLVIGGWLEESGRRVTDEWGQAVIVLAFVPATTVTVLDTWRVSGMRATASNDVSLERLFVDDRYVCGAGHRGLSPSDPARGLPLPLRFGGVLASAALGAACGALDALGLLAGTKVPVGGSVALRERADVQAAVGRARGLVEAGRAGLEKAWSEAVARASAGGPVRLQDLALLRLAYVVATELAETAVDLVCRAGGSSSLFEAEGIERCWRDAHAIAKHAALSARNYERIGAQLLNGPPESVG